MGLRVEPMGCHVVWETGPDRFQDARFVGLPGEDVPVQVMALVAQRLIVELVRPRDVSHCSGDVTQLTHQLVVIISGEFVEFGHRLAAKQHRVSRPDLVRAHHNRAHGQVNDESRVSIALT